MDLITFARGAAGGGSGGGPSGAPGSGCALAAVDCSLVAAQLGSASLEAPTSAPLVQQQRLAWTWASPLTGRGWARPDY
jgi:hypothetical protein